MPYEIKLETERCWVRSEMWGDVTDDELLCHVERMAELFSDGIIDSKWKQIANFASTEDLSSLTSGGLRRLVARNPWPLGCWRAIIAHNQLTFGLGRMYQLLGAEKGDYVGVVLTEREAREWIRQDNLFLED